MPRPRCSCVSECRATRSKNSWSTLRTRRLRDLTPPGALETLLTRMVAFLYLYEDLCTAREATWGIGFAEHLDSICARRGPHLALALNVTCLRRAAHGGQERPLPEKHAPPGGGTALFLRREDARSGVRGRTGLSVLLRRVTGTTDVCLRSGAIPPQLPSSCCSCAVAPVVHRQTRGRTVQSPRRVVPKPAHRSQNEN
jgi:hypothetical protein